MLNVRFWKSTDGGETFSQIQVPHGDNHDLWIDPDNPMRTVEGNDGGAIVSFNYIAPHAADPNIVYAGNHHWITRYDHRTKQIRDISPNPETYYGWGGADLKYRFWWTYPIMTSPHDPDVLYLTSQYVHKSTDEGQSWEVISPDLTRADPKTLEQTPSYEHPEPGEYWGPITREAYGPEWYATIFALAESPAQAGVLWAGSDDGYVNVSKDGGKSWTKVNIPDDDFTRAIREDPERVGLLYAATERTV